jgi:molybdopterin-guanine dinucleotide biosynthesis protein A
VSFTAIVLAGGRSSRGDHSPLTLLAGKPLLSHVLKNSRLLCPNQLVVGDNLAIGQWLQKSVNEHPRVNWVRDSLPGYGPLGGLYTGLWSAPTNWAICTPGYYPHVKQAFMGLLFDLREGYECVVPRVGRTAFPLLGVWSKLSMKTLERYFESGGRSGDEVLRIAAVRFVEEPELRKVDRDLSSLHRVRGPDDVKLSEQYLKTGGRVTLPPPTP